MTPKGLTPVYITRPWKKVGPTNVVSGDQVEFWSAINGSARDQQTFFPAQRRLKEHPNGGRIAQVDGERASVRKEFQDLTS